MHNTKRYKITHGLLILATIGLFLKCAIAFSEENYSVEYYRSFSGYNLPLQLVDKTTKEEAEAKAADSAYYIGYFDSERKLVRVVKMFRGAVLFENLYSYYPNGKLKRKEERKEGILSVQEFDQSGKLKSDAGQGR